MQVYRAFYLFILWFLQFLLQSLDLSFSELMGAVSVLLGRVEPVPAAVFA
jgi:hypothetical protein